MTNAELLQAIQAPRAKFYLADLHVHSPGSQDFRGTDGKPIRLSDDPRQHEDQAIAAYPVDQHYASLVSQRDHVLPNVALTGEDKASLIAITDHNVCKYACLLSEHAWESTRLKSNRLIILPGIELSVSFSVSDVQKRTTAHILLVFAPTTQEHQMFSAICNASGASWEFGQPLETHDLPNFIHSIRHHSTYPAIAVAAHVGNESGMQKETRNTILSRLDVAILRLEGEIQDAEDKDKPGLQTDLDRLREQRDDTDHVALEVLHLLGKCGFDALQVACRSDQQHYRRLHRCRRQLGRAVPIVASDAHSLSDVFCAGGDGEEKAQPFLKLPSNPCALSSSDLFDEVRKRGLRYGETRFSYVPPGRVTTWVEAVEITPDAADAKAFWLGDSHVTPSPDAEAGKARFIMPLSRNLNCLIGGRGSGKSAAIEAAAFLTSPDQFNEKESRKEDWYRRAAATLNGCRIRLLWRFLNHPTVTVRKSAIFVTRYFDPANSHRQTVATDIEEKEVSPAILKDLTVELFRLHDIETIAEPGRLRGLFDRICGTKISDLQDEIATLIKLLTSQRAKMIEVAKKLGDLTANHSALRAYVDRKLAYDAVNRKEIKDDFEGLDNAEAAEGVVKNAVTQWNDIVTRFATADRRQDVEDFFTSLAEQVLVASQQGDEQPDPVEPPKPQSIECKPYLQPLLPLVQLTSGTEGAPTPRQSLDGTITALAGALTGIDTTLGLADREVSAAHAEARASLAKKGFPKGAEDRQAKKRAFDEASQLLEDYRQKLAEWYELVEERAKTFATLKQKCVERTELRRQTAESITERLAHDLDKSVLQIEANAQPMSDKQEFARWLEKEIEWSPKYKKERIAALLDKGVMPEVLRSELLKEDTLDADVLVIDRARVQDGKIAGDDAAKILEMLRCVVRLEPEKSLDGCPPDVASQFPKEIREGLLAFQSKGDAGKVPIADAVLRLDEIVFDDQPVILLNDRPREKISKKPLENLSHGQRCSAILPILLLTGSNPLIIDQPEDNLDNRLIRQVVVNVLASIKLRRQVIVATHNPNLPVLGDAEQVIALRAVDDDRCEVRAMGALDDEHVVHHVTEIMEGGREAFQYRHSVYEEYWTGGASNR